MAGGGEPLPYGKQQVVVMREYSCHAGLDPASGKPRIPAFAAALVFLMLVLGCRCTAFAAAGATETAGDLLQYALPVVAVGVVVAQHDSSGALQFGESFALTLGTTYALKIGIDETRPNGGHYAFPSGHTSSTFSCAEFLRGRYGWRYGVPAYLAAAFVGYSRVESRNHYTHDVVAGAAIGILSSHIFTTRYLGWQVGLNADHDFLGVSLSRAW